MDQSQQLVSVRITQEAYLKMKYFIEECKTEISGFGKVRQFEEESSDSLIDRVHSQVFQIYDVEILPQDVSGVHASIDEETLAKFITEKLSKGEDLEQYRCWWHSHVEMAAFFSGTDTKTIDESTEFKYLISIVGNKRHEFKVRLDLYRPFRLTFEDLVLQVEQPANEELRKQCKEEIKKKINPKKSFLKNFFRDKPQDPLDRAFQR